MLLRIQRQELSGRTEPGDALLAPAGRILVGTQIRLSRGDFNALRRALRIAFFFALRRSSLLLTNHRFLR
ncbi:MAG: hypothetical protein M5U01_05040 [Ardenticatenaceae bacterium]|nr:hypothetical protein [Ardenticatenaceae bacterium]